VYSDRLNQISNHAMQLERTDPGVAALVWRQALDLLPPDARQAQYVRQRIRALEGGPPETAPASRNDTWPIALLKTGGSMLLSILVYAAMFSASRGPAFGLLFATGFVLLILVHELGHTFAMRHFGLSASPPIFIPFMGALINLRQPPRNAWEEAVVGIGGPRWGRSARSCAMQPTSSPATICCSCSPGSATCSTCSTFCPFPPLDGGRITAAVSPWIWMPGLLGLVWMIFYEWRTTGSPSFLLIMLLFFAWPRIVQTLRRRQRGEASAYYDISRRSKWDDGRIVLWTGRHADRAVLHKPHGADRERRAPDDLMRLSLLPE
jgi:hypothetical protein